MFKTSGWKNFYKMLIFLGKFTPFSFNKKRLQEMLIIFRENPSIYKGFRTFQHFQHPLLQLLLPNIYWFLSTLRRVFRLFEALVLRKEKQGLPFLGESSEIKKSIQNILFPKPRGLWNKIEEYTFRIFGKKQDFRISDQLASFWYKTEFDTSALARERGSV